MNRNTVEALEMELSFRRGEEKGFNYFFNLFYPSLLYYATNLISDKETAKDSISEAFMKAWERKELFVNERHLKSWIYTTTRNLCLTKWKSYNKRRLDIEMAESEIENGVDLLMIKAEVYDQLYSFINHLPPGCRRIVSLLYFERKTTNEICAELNLAETTVKNQKARGLKLLRKMYRITEEQAYLNEKKKIENILKSEASIVSLANRYGLSGHHINYIKEGKVKHINKMRKIV